MLTANGGPHRPAVRMFPSASNLEKGLLNT
jgi:hypothetical protein